MAEETKKEEQQNDNDLVKVVKEEYEKKIADLQKEHKEEIDKIKKEEHEKSVQTIRAIMSGKKIEEEKNAPEDSDSMVNQLIKDTREKLGLKGGN